MTYLPRVARGVANSNRLRDRPANINRPIPPNANVRLAIEARKALGWSSSRLEDYLTPRQAGDRTGINPSTIVHLLDGRPVKPSTVRKFAVGMGLDCAPFMEALGLMLIESGRNVMYVRVWDRMAEAMEWRLVVFVDKQWIVTDSLRGGMLLRFRLDSGVSETDYDIKLHALDRAAVSREYEEVKGLQE